MGLVCLPLHVWDRELDSRILLACLLANDGHQIVFGHEHNMQNLYSQYRNIFFYGAGKPIYNQIRSEWHSNVIKNDGYVALTFEEGLNDVQSNYYVQFAGITAAGIRNITKIYSWCQTEKNLMLSQTPLDIRSQLDAKTVLVGSIRLELLGSLGLDYFQVRSHSISSFIGPHVLISDNFGFDSYGSRTPYDLTSDLMQRISDSSYLEKVLSRRKEYLVRAKHARIGFTQVIEKMIAANPSTLFVLRPHPVADPRFWYENIFPFRNLHIIYKDSVEPWLHASKTIVHAGCTVGLQAELFGKKSIDIASIYNDKRILGASSKCSTYTPRSIDELHHTLSLPDAKFEFNQPRIIATQSRQSYLHSNMSSLNPHTLSQLSSIDLTLPSSSALSTITNDVNQFFALREVSTISPTVISQILGTNPPLPGKSRLYDTSEIIARIKLASKVLKLSTNLKFKHFKNSHAFFLSS